MSYQPLPFAQALGNWLTQKWVQDFSFRMHDPAWKLSKSSTPGVKFDRPKFDELAKAVRSKIRRLPGGQYIEMYMMGMLFIGPGPSPRRQQPGVEHKEGREQKYREDSEDPIMPTKPTMLVKVKAGAYSKTATDLIDIYLQEMDEYTALMVLRNNLPRRPVLPNNGPPPFVTVDPTSVEAEYILKMGCMVAEGIEAVLSSELKGEDALRHMCAVNAPVLDLQRLWTALREMHTGNNERAYEDLLNRIDALMLTGGDDGLEPFLLSLNLLCDDFKTQGYEVPVLAIKSKFKNAFARGRCEAGADMRVRIVQRYNVDGRPTPQGQDLVSVMLKECMQLRELQNKFQIPSAKAMTTSAGLHAASSDGAPIPKKGIRHSPSHSRERSQERQSSGRRFLRSEEYPKLRPRDDVRENMDCYNCGMKNHMAQHCSRPAETRYAPTSVRQTYPNNNYVKPKNSLQGEVLCDFCNHPWHESKHCLLNKNRIRSIPSRARSRSPRPAPRSRINLVEVTDKNIDFSLDKDLEDSWVAEPAEHAVDALEFDETEVIELKQDRGALVKR